MDPPVGQTTVDANRSGLTEERLPAGSRAGTPGIVLLLDNGCAVSRAIPVTAAGLELGRGSPPGCFVQDDWVSRAHLRVHHAEGEWRFEDLGSRNGSYVNGGLIQDASSVSGDVLVRLGRSLCWARQDISAHLEADPAAARPNAGEGQEVGPVLGAALRRAWRELRVAVRASDTLLVTGPSGAGKELAARAYHQVAHGDNAHAPFVAVNCATISSSIAERLLFGTKRGAYSGATQDAVGFVQAASGGTLFLDEVAELEPAVQAKLLRVLENREVTPLGSTQTQPVQLRVCVATLRDLRAEVTAGRFREDLYYRIGRPAIRIPPLTERLDELPVLAERTLASIDPRLRPGTDLVEACALRPWPGNVRELIGELRHAAFAALDNKALLVGAEFLAPDAGRALSEGEKPDLAVGSRPRSATAWPSDDAIRAALERDGGNVSAAARALGLHRNQLRRWLSRQ
ncbi:MAG: sigma 54-interacting transcriptional regulator [Myxococcales bacterium]|nr:sigma 54-interacting transcriptional regulator [Myxococcales bacterium]